MTVYRDGCRDGVLTTESSTESNKRPKAIACDIKHSTVKGKQYFVLVGLDKNKEPYEVFAGKNGVLDKSIKVGKIVKEKRGFYQLISEDGKDLYLAPVTAASSEEEETVTRLTSLALQSGASIHDVVKQLERVEGETHGFARAIARVLKNYIPDNTLEGEACPECKAPLVREQGCKNCKTCGWTACS